MKYAENRLPQIPLPEDLRFGSMPIVGLVPVSLFGLALTAKKRNMN